MQTFTRLARAGFVWISVCVLFAGVSSAQNQQADDTTLPADVAADFDQRLTEIAQDNVEIERLEQRIAASEGVLMQVLEIRRDSLWTSMFQSTLDLARDVANRRDNGQDVANYENLLANQLLERAPEAIAAIQRMRSRTVFPTEEAPPEEYVVGDQRLFRQVDEVDALYSALIDYVEVAERMNLDASNIVDFLTGSLVDTAATRSVFLEMVIGDVQSLRAAAAILPENADLASRLAAAEARVRMTASAMQTMITLMNELELDTRAYRQQVLTATGEITTDVLDVGIMANLAKEWSVTVGRLVASEGPRFLFRALLVVLILFVFYQFAKLVQKGVARGLDASKLYISHLLRRMILSTVRNLVIILGILIAISQLGISLGPLLAGLGIAGFIVGFALQDTLSNFASGIMILIYRPFDVGDVVEAGGVSGKVSHMSLVNTTFMTFDNQRLIVPNNAIWGSVITNLTAQTTRRVDLTFGISYSEDIEKAEKALREVVTSHEAVLDDPEPMIKMHELADSSVNYIVRPWVKTENYWDTYWDLTRAIKKRFDEEGISIPFPQRDVHVVEQRQAE